MDEETLPGADEQTDCVPETPKRALHLGNEQRQSTPSIVPSPCVQELDEDDELCEVDAVKSTQDEFASVRWYVRPRRYEQYADPFSSRSIPETPPPSSSTILEAVARIEEGENLDVDGRVVASKHRKTKRKRVEPILSSEEDESTTSEGITSM